jgi:hypothetical protein
MKSSFHSLIPSLPLFCSCQFRRLDSIQFLCTQVHIPAGWRLETRLFTVDYSTRTRLLTVSFYNHSVRTMQKTASLLLRRLTGSLRSNGHTSVARVRFTRMYLSSCCLALGIHATVLFLSLLGSGAVFPELKLAQREAHRSRPTGALIKNACSFTSAHCTECVMPRGGISTLYHSSRVISLHISQQLFLTSFCSRRIVL